MALEDRVGSTVNSALEELTARLDRDVRSILQQLITAANEERDEALTVARNAALDEAAAETQRQVEEAEARVRATIDDQVARAREEERTQVTLEIRQQVEAEFDQKLAEALAAAETRMQVALADAEATSTQVLNDTVSEARVREREAEMAELTRMLESVRGLDGATSLSEVLDALGHAAGREASRAAVLVLRNERLLGWKLSGFGPRDAQPKGIDLGLNDSGVIGVAVNTARPVTTRDGAAAAEGPGFVHLPPERMGFAVPVIVGGRVVAVVYADSVASDGHNHTVPSGWPEVVEILARHAARCLEALTVQKAANAPSPRFWVPQSAGPATQAGATPPSKPETPPNVPV